MSYKWIRFQISSEDLRVISGAAKIKFGLDDQYDINHKQQKVLKDILTVGKIN
jgi:hypothetical protein